MNKDKKVVFDVGMHKGEDTDFYLQKGFNVVAFEANPELVKFCENKFANEIKEERLIIVEGAIIDPEFDSDSSNPNILFYRNINMSVWGTIDSNWAKRNEKKRH
jgi:16S rRNA A1518/A1519 N6-dimethyltransferase RsmA/KsgA/DIM1 with predicted DNA glycosylase/AP lyase activity